MFQVLNAYLFQHRSISVPGLGTIYLETDPASVDVANRTMLPPRFYFRFDKYFDAPEKEFFSYIANQQHILEYEAIKWYNEFSYDFRNRVRLEERASWDGVGYFLKDSSGNFVLEPLEGGLAFLAAVPAMRVNRQDAEHTLLVGDREKTNFEMNELLQEETNSKRKYWWIYALVLAVLALGFLAWHFYNNGWQTGYQLHW